MAIDNGNKHNEKKSEHNGKKLEHNGKKLEHNGSKLRELLNSIVDKDKSIIGTCLQLVPFLPQ